MKDKPILSEQEQKKADFDEDVMETICPLCGTYLVSKSRLVYDQQGNVIGCDSLNCTR